MTRIKKNEDFQAWVLQWTARLISTTVALFLALMGFGEGLEEIRNSPADPENAVAMVIVAFVLAYLVAVVIAWFKEKTGGIMLVVLGFVAIVAFMATEQASDYWVTLIIGAPFLVSGVLFLWCWKRIHKAEAAAD